MMEFKFQWHDDCSTDNIVTPIQEKFVDNEWFSINDGNMELIKNLKVDILTFEKNIKISIYNQNNLEMNILNNTGLISSGIVHNLKESNDIESGIYEGGFTLWDGSKNLVEYLIKEDVEFLDKSILELGCGYGLPGIFSLLQNAKSVCFQDFNTDVLKFCTIPNVLLNLGDKSHENISFVSGDWTLLPNNNIEKSSFDIILTAETIYRPSHYKILLDLFKHVLKPNGKVYLNTKSIYYGVGGNLNDFISLVKDDNVFDFEMNQTSHTGALRYVIVMWFK